MGWGEGQFEKKIKIYNLRCSKLNYSKPEGGKKRKGELISEESHGQKRLLTFLNAC